MVKAIAAITVAICAIVKIILVIKIYKEGK
jgi:hypothetical protein